ncbi:UNVERIFIED_CONTAM: hypothetical protein FKN15_039475 [Acipenser sinensis]
MVGLQSKKKRSADGTCFGGQHVLVFATLESAQVLHQERRLPQARQPQEVQAWQPQALQPWAVQAQGRAVPRKATAAADPREVTASANPPTATSPDTRKKAAARAPLFPLVFHRAPVSSLYSGCRGMPASRPGPSLVDAPFLLALGTATVPPPQALRTATIHPLWWWRRKQWPISLGWWRREQQSVSLCCSWNGNGSTPSGSQDGNDPPPLVVETETVAHLPRVVEAGTAVRLPLLVKTETAVPPLLGIKRSCLFTSVLLQSQRQRAEHRPRYPDMETWLCNPDRHESDPGSEAKPPMALLAVGVGVGYN